MERYIALLGFENEIENIEQSQLGKFEVHLKIIQKCRDVLSNLREEVVAHGFPDKNSEISFFKIKKQVPMSSLIYYSELYYLESLFPKGNTKKQKMFIQKKVDEIDRFLKININFVQYITIGYNHMDVQYFTREGSFLLPNWSNSFYSFDQEFNTSHDLLLAKITAFERLCLYLSERMLNLENIQFTTKSDLKWTASKVSLTELVYALQHSNSINNGKAGIKLIADGLQKVFNFDLGDYYRTYSEIRQRKKSRTKFLDELSISMINQLHEEEH